MQQPSVKYEMLARQRLADLGSINPTTGCNCTIVSTRWISGGDDVTIGFASQDALLQHHCRSTSTREVGHRRELWVGPDPKVAAQVLVLIPVRRNTGAHVFARTCGVVSYLHPPLGP